MRSLANLLETALQRSATEVVLESGQPVVFMTARGAESEPNVLPRTDLFDMIVAAVDDSQQIELAVGNPVEFEIDAGGRWSVFAEPGMEGMTVRARRDGMDLPSLEIELEHESDGFGVSEFSPPGFDDPGLPDDDAFEVEFDAADSGSRRPRPPSEAPPSQLHVEALDVPTLQDSDGDFNAPPRSAPAAPFESGTWALADEEDFDVGLDDPDEGKLPTGFPEPPRSPALDVDNGIGVPDDDDDSFDPFTDGPGPADSDPRRTLSPTLPAVGAVAPAGSKPLPPIKGAPIKPPPPIRSAPASSVASTPTRREMTAASSSSAAATRRELTPLSSPEADTRRELPRVGQSGAALDDLPTAIGEGALVYIHEPGLAESLAQAFAAPSITIDDQIGPDEVWSRIRGLPIGTIVIVRRDDPSTLLAWMLRRLEEGYRVFLETRARTPEGARRILLGVGATDRAERWLDSQVSLVVEAGESGPRVRRTN